MDRVLQRRRKKLRKRQQEVLEGSRDDVTVTVTDELSLLASVKMDAKIKYVIVNVLGNMTSALI